MFVKKFRNNSVIVDLAEGITKDCVLLLLGEVIKWIPIGYLLVVLPIYLHQIGFDPFLIGSFITASGLAIVITLPLTGYLSDRYGRRPFLIIGFLLSIPSYVILILSNNVYLIATAYILGGLGMPAGISDSIAAPSWLTMLAESSKEKYRTKIFTLGMVSFSAALSIGALLSFLPTFFQTMLSISFRNAHQLVFIILILINIVAVIVVFPVKETLIKTDLKKTDKETDSAERSFKKFPNKRLIFKFMFATIPTGATFMVLQLSPLWFNLKYGIGEAEIGPWFAASNIIAIIFMLSAPILVNKVGIIRALILSWFIGGVLMLVMPNSPYYQFAAIIYILFSSIFYLTTPIRQSFALEIFPPSARAFAMAITFAAFTLSGSIVSMMGGYLLSGMHLSLPFYIVAVAQILSVILTYIFFRNWK